MAIVGLTISDRTVPGTGKRIGGEGGFVEGSGKSKLGCRLGA